MTSSSAPTWLFERASDALTSLRSDVADVIGGPARWLAAFVDDADDVWAIDPLLDDDDTSSLAW